MVELPSPLARVSVLALIALIACTPPVASPGTGGTPSEPTPTATSDGTPDPTGPPATPPGSTATATTPSTTLTGSTPPPDDPCATAVPVCPGASPTASGAGLVALDRCAFALDVGAAFTSLAPLVDDLAAVADPATLTDVMADLNRAPPAVDPSAIPGDPPGATFAFRWEDSENDKTTWIPQGLTGSADADVTGLVDGRRWVVASFYYDEDAPDAADPKGVRLAWVDITDPDAPAYRFVLLVEPLVGPDGGPDWGPVQIHAGGIAWVGDHLYVADTFAGLRVFDTTRMYRADTSEDVIGCDGTSCKAGLYAYALPQIGAYDLVAPCAPAERFSFLSVDRSIDPPQLVTGEYCSATSCADPLAGRLFRYPLDPLTSLVAPSAPSTVRTWPTDAWYAGETQIQGAGASGGVFYLSSSEPAGGAGALYRVDAGGSATYGWIDSPEDVMIDVSAATGGGAEIASLSEAVSERYVFGADLAAYGP